jgi:hypothetical protein
MCFSATASFTASAVLATIGVATLRHVREPRALLFACVPLLFAVHQFSEGMVWLALEGRLGPTARDHLVFLYTLYAIGILPLLMPAAVALMEPPGWRRGAILALCGVGALVFAFNMTGLVVAPPIATRSPARCGCRCCISSRPAARCCCRRTAWCADTACST